jgi:hypothetical protein
MHFRRPMARMRSLTIDILRAVPGSVYQANFRVFALYDFAVDAFVTIAFETALRWVNHLLAMVAYWANRQRCVFSVSGWQPGRSHQ